MNFSKSVLLVLIILVCFSIPSVLSNFTVLKNLLSVFRGSPAANSSSTNETSQISSNESSPAESLPAEKLPAESSPTRMTSNPPVDHQSLPASHLKSTNQRSSLIAADDNKFSSTGVFKDGLFRGNFISQLQEMIKRKSVELSEQSAIVNDEDVDEEKEPDEDEPNQPSGLIAVLATDHREPINAGEDEEYEDDEDEFAFHKKSTADEAEVNGGNDLKLPPRGKLIEQIFDKLNEEMKSLAAIIKSGNKTGALEIESNKTGQLNETVEQQVKHEVKHEVNHEVNHEVKQEVKQPLGARGAANETVQLNQTTQANETDQRPSTIKSFYHFDNSTNTTSYTYLGAEQAENSNLLPTVLNSKLLGNTLESLEKILEKYTFLNLYPAPTINDTHNDRDLHQKEDQRVVLKANFADYSGYANTEKSTIIGEAPPVQNLTDITWGNVRVLNSSGVGHSNDIEGDEKIEIIKS